VVLSSEPRAEVSTPPLDAGLLRLLFLTVFAAAGTIHYQSPLLAQFGREFGANPAAVGWVATLSFGGFVVGNLFLLPLGDRFEKRRLVLIELACLVGALLATASATTLPALAAGAFATGVCASLALHLMAIATELASPERRGRAVGTVLSGVYLGILFGRVAAGLVATHLGWRWIYVLAAVALLALFPALARRLPKLPAATGLSYGALMGSLLQLFRARPELRRASATQFLLGICYGGFWATLAQMLSALHGLGPTGAGLIGIPGAAGVLVARPAGQWADRRGSGPVVTVGIAAVTAAYLTLGFAGVTLVAVVLGAILLDCGLRSTLVANHALVSGNDAETRSRSITVFAVHIQGGNAAGGFVATTALAHAGWWGVVAAGTLASASALLLQLRANRRSGRAVRL
jgi:predicted MFS family arabinose efflux permease